MVCLPECIFVTDDITDRWTMAVAYDASHYSVCFFVCDKVLMGTMLEHWSLSLVYVLYVYMGKKQKKEENFNTFLE